jgi:hypothetical protein
MTLGAWSPTGNGSPARGAPGVSHRESYARAHDFGCKKRGPLHPLSYIKCEVGTGVLSPRRQSLLKASSTAGAATGTHESQRGDPVGGAGTAASNVLDSSKRFPPLRMTTARSRWLGAPETELTRCSRSTDNCRSADEREFRSAWTDVRVPRMFRPGFGWIATCGVRTWPLICRCRFWWSMTTTP